MKEFFRNKSHSYIYIALIIVVLSGVFLYGREYYVNEIYADEKIREETTLMFRKEYKDSDVVKYFDDESPPEMFRSFSFDGFSKRELEDFLPDPWEVEEFSESLVSLVYEGKEYSETETEMNQNENGEFNEIKYIGIYKDRIAIYRGDPSNEELIEVTTYEVKDVYRADLARGIPFTTEEERERILESYTS